MSDSLTKKKIPKRMCIACREMHEKRELLRIVKAKDQNIAVPDFKGKVNGRGAYICKTQECLLKAIKIKAIERALGAGLDDEAINMLKEEFNESEG